MTDNEIKDARNQIVAQGNYFVRHARTKLTSQEMNIVHFLISKVKPQDKDFMTVCFSVQDFCKICGMDPESGYNYFGVKNALRLLRNKSVWVEYRNENGKKEEILFSWLDTAKITYGSGEMQVTLSQSIKPFLIGLIESGHYTQSALINFLAMRSQYSKRLYEIVKSYTPLRSLEDCQKEFQIQNLKKLLGAETYSRFADFKRRVLDVAMREINSVTDIVVSYTTRRYLGTTDFVIFHFKLKDSISLGRARSEANIILDGPSIKIKINDISENQSPDVSLLPHQQLQDKFRDKLFEELWKKVLRKEGKPKARKAFGEALKNGVSYEEISSVLDSYNAYVKAEGIEGRYIKAGGNWFAERYWENEYTVTKKKSKSSFHDFNQREYDWAAIEKAKREEQNEKYGFTD